MALKNGNPEHRLTAEEVRKGGKNSVIARRKKKTNQEILKNLLEIPCDEFPHFKEIAKRCGFNGTIKELYNFVCLLNTCRKGTIDDIGKLSTILGEQTELDGNNENVQETLIKIKETALEYNRNKSQTE